MENWTWISRCTVQHYRGNTVTKMPDGTYRAHRRLANGFDPIGDFTCPREAGAAAVSPEHYKPHHPT